jgi:hypothetical protein
MYQQRVGARAEYREQESQRVKDSATLARRFGQLKSLTVELTYYDPDRVSKGSELKYQVNLSGAKSVFRFNCPNAECVRGDFDLSKELAKAIAARQTSVSGEKTCKGWRSKTTIQTVRCHNVLRYKLTLKY